MGAFADRAAERKVAYEERRADRDDEVKAFAESKKRKKQQVEEHRAVVERQPPGGKGAADRGDPNSVRGRTFKPTPAMTTVLGRVKVGPTVKRVVYRQGDYETAPRAGSPDVPMQLPWEPPPLGALMVFGGKNLLMTMPYMIDDADELEMKRLYQIPRNSNVHVRVHTGRGNVKPGQPIAAREQAPSGPGGSYGRGISEIDWLNLPRDLNDIIATGLRERFFWWFDTFLDEWGLFGRD